MRAAIASVGREKAGFLRLRRQNRAHVGVSLFDVLLHGVTSRVYTPNQRGITPICAQSVPSNCGLLAPCGSEGRRQHPSTLRYPRALWPARVYLEISFVRRSEPK